MANRFAWGVALAAGCLAGPACGGGYDAWAQTREPGYGGASGAHAPAAVSAGAAADYGDVDEGRYELPRPEREASPRYAQAETPPRAEPTATDGRQGPLLIYTAQIGLAVHQVSDKQDRVEALAREAGGHLHRRTDAEIVIRVPAGRFEQVLAAILEVGDVLSRDVSVQDVSEEFRDVETRIRTLEAMYARVTRLLEGATNVEHALSVEQHLERITLELERLRGRLRFLSDRVAFSTITVRFTERATVSPPRFELPFAWLRQLGLPSLLRLQ